MPAAPERLAELLPAGLLGVRRLLRVGVIETLLQGCDSFSQRVQ
jgi:hypothetical protein